MKKLIVFSLAFSFLLAFSCTKEEIEEMKPDPMDDQMDDVCETAGVSYSNDIQTILSGCTSSSCHGSGSFNGSMANYEDAKTFAGAGRILGALNHQPGFSAMPKNGGKLDDCKISFVAAWIEAGFPE